MLQDLGMDCEKLSGQFVTYIAHMEQEAGKFMMSNAGFPLNTNWWLNCRKI